LTPPAIEDEKIEDEKIEDEKIEDEKIEVEDRGTPICSQEFKRSKPKSNGSTSRAAKWRR
jgi:hypothetical protein